MSFFKFMAEIPRYCEDARAIQRLNKRHRLLVDPFRAELKNARVLDLGAHDGRWAYALANAGAREVIAVEARQEAIDRFADFPETPFKSRVKMVQGDLFEALEQFCADGTQFDVVVLYGIFYHIMDHMRLLQLIHRLGPGTILIDSEFSLSPGGSIVLVIEDTDKDTNATPQVAGQLRALVGIPTFGAMEKMADAIGYDLTWAETDTRIFNDKKGVQDYFRAEKKRRAYCVLRAPTDTG